LATAIWPSAFAKVLQIVRQGGTISFVGLSPGDFATPIFDAVLKPITRSGSIVGTLQDLKEAIEFAAYGKVKAHIHRSHLEDIKTVFENLKSGTVDGRVVLEPPRTPVDSSCIGRPAPGQPPYNSN
jgi:propanol-preferring alcohol dehydrogenase